MKFLEKNLESIVLESKNSELVPRGLPISGYKASQRRIGNYGILDIITFDRVKGAKEAVITIYELKKDELCLDTFIQASRYVKGVDRYLKRRGVSFKYTFKIVLVGYSLNTEDWVYLADHLNGFLRLFTYQYSIDGIRFTEQNGFHLIDEKFK